MLQTYKSHTYVKYIRTTGLETYGSTGRETLYHPGVSSATPRTEQKDDLQIDNREERCSLLGLRKR